MGLFVSLYKRTSDLARELMHNVGRKEERVAGKEGRNEGRMAGRIDKVYLFLLNKIGISHSSFK